MPKVYTENTSFDMSLSFDQSLNTVLEEMVDICITDSFKLPPLRVCSKSQLIHHQNPSSSSLGSRVGSRVSLVKRPSQSVLTQMLETRPVDLMRPVSGDSLASDLDPDFLHSRLSSLTSTSDSEFLPETLAKDHSQSQRRKRPEARTIPGEATLRTRNNESIPFNGPSRSFSGQSRSFSGQARTNGPFAPLDSTSSLTRKASNSSEITLKLQPHQKYRLNRMNRKQSQQDLDQALKDDIDLDDDDIPGDVVWNVPMAGGYFPRTHSKSAVSLQPTPLPGQLEHLYNPQQVKSMPDIRGSYPMLSISRGISDYYSAKQLEELQKRSRSNPSVRNVPEASETAHGTRDIWLPPKNPLELRKHEQEIARLAGQRAQKEVQELERQSKLRQQHEHNEQKWFKFSLSSNFKKASRLEVKLLVWQTPVPARLRHSLWAKNLQYHLHKTGSKQDEVLDKFEVLSRTLDTLDMAHKQEEMTRCVHRLTQLPMFRGVGELFLASFKRLVLLLLVSRSGLLYGDELLIGSLLVFFPDRTLKEVFEMTQLMKLLVVNEKFVKKLTKGLGNTYFKRLLAGFPQELAGMNSKTLWVLWSLTDGDAVKRFLEILVVVNDYKLALAYVLTVVKQYHFGWLSLAELERSVGLRSAVVDVKDLELFVVRLKGCYKEL
ncbi:hypothetical protein BABINDRAFT_119030 [Babjeviella inositovora NRRL Y-12698]|uniref:Sbe2/Sbe22 C-terminal domain-containing protein n=1 Tax=Babjeviella inositovora NRRL Y-12698 TaxID=984486 RepID=A0A1E3QTJ4_9ASCO|nr:uncharacterized protein BABINDRAFT_119030 [Babjeviella inositovora NRRL Y-12698]ODQ81011.1 hypothetical protein BABINDRAFT_119030 [Babjeviella inositovora NRRL Y-12698]